MLLSKAEKPKFGLNQPSGSMGLNMFSLQKKIDVRSLKQNLWAYINPKLRLESRAETEASPVRPPEPEPVQMSEILFEMYNSGQIDQQNVSVNSAFICMLHLANEQSLEFTTEKGNERDFKVVKNN